MKVGLDCNSGYTKGKCHRCNICWYWPKGKQKVKDTKCPDCGGSLRPTVHYLKSAPWRPLPTKKGGNDGEDCKGLKI